MIRLRTLSRAVLLYATVGLAALMLALWPTAVARADSPFDDPAFRLPQGGAHGDATSKTTTVAVLPEGYTELPHPISIAAMPARSLSFQPGTPQDPNNPLDWLNLSFNPGKWLLDSVLGALSGIILSITSIFQTVAIWAFGPGVTVAQGASVAAAPSGLPANIAGEGIVFTTPLRFTTAPEGSLSATSYAHGIVMSATLSIMVLVFTFRCIKLITSHRREDIVDLVVAFVSGMVVTLGSWGICDLMIKAANVIGAEIGRRYTFWDGTMLFPFADVTSSTTGLYLTFTLVGLCYWGLMVVLAFKAIGRIALINLLLIVSPLAGLGIMSGGWSYAKIWFFRMVELLVTPIAWLLVLGFLRNLLLAFSWSNPIIPYVMGCYVLFITPKAPAVLGLAAQTAWSHGKEITQTITRAVTVAASAL